MTKLKLTKASLFRLKHRASEAIKDPDKYMGFSISPEAVLLLLDALEKNKNTYEI